MHGRSLMTIDLQCRGGARRVFTDQADIAGTWVPCLYSSAVKPYLGTGGHVWDMPLQCGKHDQLRALH